MTAVRLFVASVLNHNLKMNECIVVCVAKTMQRVIAAKTSEYAPDPSAKALFTSRSDFRILKAIHASIFDSTDLVLGRVGLTAQIGQPHRPRPSHCSIGKMSKNIGKGNLLSATGGPLACFQFF